MTASEQSAPAALRFDRVVKTFEDFWGRPRVKALDGLDLQIHPGEVFGLLGPNGSGKSTAIKIALGLLFPTSGTVSLDGRSPEDLRTRRELGYLPEESCLHAFLTPQETLDLHGSLHSLSSAERRRRAEELLHMVGLDHVATRQVGELSKGMRRRLGLAQSLIHDPRLIILDEPTSGLDPLGTRQVKDLVLELGRRGKTVILSSHLLADLEGICDRFALLYGGRKLGEGTRDELLVDEGGQRITLESYFLRTVQAAREAGATTSGARGEGTLPTFIGGSTS